MFRFFFLLVALYAILCIFFVVIYSLNVLPVFESVVCKWSTRGDGLEQGAYKSRHQPVTESESSFQNHGRPKTKLMQFSYLTLMLYVVLYGCMHRTFNQCFSLSLSHFILFWFHIKIRYIIYIRMEQWKWRKKSLNPLPHCDCDYLCIANALCLHTHNNQIQLQIYAAIQRKSCNWICPAVFPHHFQSNQMHSWNVSGTKWKRHIILFTLSIW